MTFKSTFQPFRILWTLALFGVMLASPAPADLYTHRDGFVQAVSIGPDNGLVFDPLVDTGLAPLASGLAQAADGRLFGIINAGATVELFVVDLDLGTTEVVGMVSPPISDVLDITFDGMGTLWVLGSPDTLYQIDPATGAATAISGGWTGLEAIAATSGGELYGVENDGAGSWQLVDVDPSGVSTPIVELAGIDTLGSTTVVAMDVDIDGNLWLNVRDVFGLGVPVFETRLLRYASSLDGQPDMMSEPLPFQDSRSLAASRFAPAALPIPVLSVWGLTLLSAGLGLLGFRRLRRRHD